MRRSNRDTVATSRQVTLLLGLMMFCLLATLLWTNAVASNLPTSPLRPASPLRPVSPLTHSNLDPVAQCAEGVRLYHAGDGRGALPLVTHGFELQSEEFFSDLNAAGECGLVLGILQYNDEEFEDALGTLVVVRSLFQGSGDLAMEGVALKYLGAAYEEQGEYEQALAMYEAGAEIFAHERLEEAKMLIAMGRVHMVIGGDEMGDEDFAAAREALERARGLLSPSDAGIYLQTLIQLAQTNVELEQYDEALASYEDVLAIVGRPAERAAILDEIGIIHLTRKDREMAAEVLRKAVAIWQGLGEEERQGRSEALLLVIDEQIGQERKEKADALQKEGKNSEAIAAYRSAVSAYRAAVARKAEGDVWMEIGKLYESTEKDQEALNAYVEARSAYRKINDQLLARRYCSPVRRTMFSPTTDCSTPTMNDLTPARAGEGRAAAAIGHIQREQGQWGAALNNYLQAVAILESVSQFDNEAILAELKIAGGMDYYVETRPSQASAHANAGEILLEQGRPLDAQTHFIAALALLNDVRTYPSMHGIVIEPDLSTPYTETYGLQEAITRSDLASAYSSTGRMGEARAEYAHALAMAHGQAYSERTEALILYNSALLEMQEGNNYRAADYLSQVADLAKQVEAYDILARVLGNQGELQEQGGDADAARQLYEEALTLSAHMPDPEVEVDLRYRLGVLALRGGDVTAAVDYLERSVAALELLRPVSGNDLVRAKFTARYAEQYAVLIAAYHAAGQDDQAFYASERSRARSFLDTLASGRIQLQDSVSNAVLAEATAVYNDLQAVQLRISYAEISLAEQQPLAELLARQEELEENYQGLVAQIQAEDSRIGMLLPNLAAVATVTQTQSLLGAETTLVSYHVFGDYVLAFVVTRDDLQSVLMPVDYDELVQHVTNLTLFANRNQAHPPAAEKLYGMLVAPLKQYLLTPQLIVVPHNVLHYLPFVALSDGHRQLIDDYALRVVPSASILRQLATRPETRGDEGTHRPALILAAPALPASVGEALPLLRYAAAGAEVLGAPDLLAATPLLGAAATETVLRQKAASAGIIHLAVHGRFDVGDPLASELLLASDSHNDGRLSVAEVYQFDLRQSHLVVLSACQSQINVLAAGNAIGRGDEVFSLTRAFLFAGAPAVVATLWSVDDRATELLLQEFYRRVLEGEDNATALQHAQITLRDSSPRYASPYFWAGFVLTGS